MSHGIGRSGDIMAVQPKSAGSSLMYQLTNSLCLDLMLQLGVRHTKSCILLPVATGMGLVLSILTIKLSRPSSKYIIWSRIDQKSSFKSIISSGCQPVVIELVRIGDELSTNIVDINHAINDFGAENITCIITTTSCFAPRIPDNIPEVAKICKEYDIPHITNNAFGLQSTKCMHLIEEAMKVGRLDAFVQSTDKNLLVPVGGCIIGSGSKAFIESIGQNYPGRASATPILDTFITMLQLGTSGYKLMLVDRVESYIYLKKQLVKLAEKYNERVLITPHNQISMAFTLSSFHKLNSSQITRLGSMLFTRFVSGTRVIPADANPKKIGNYTFKNFGAHCNDNIYGYLTCSASLGISKKEIDIFIKRLDSVLPRLCVAGSNDEDIQ
ncbi:O-phosphoseryl-tRNA(Sec) selenium transferase isoform X2 [Oopsacas minuta]|uniref:O-phosphoseryl-tRNA(Sec) selenium transferase n=1 Tax=Oopsacas minuta TaxID=111878 RepID=A0AAV7KFT0_9METZ|nr:O-phosphoseryl-tRNA(Sec) selenium transferase isoform X2 [Oopsacas minuta]